MRSPLYTLMVVPFFCSAIHDAKYIANGHKELIRFESAEIPGSTKTIMREGVLIRKEHARAIVLICHGFMCNKHDIQFLADIFNEYTTFTFDFRAHGTLTKNQYCTFGLHEAEDVIGAVRTLKADPLLKNLPIIVYGFSMGAVASLIAQSKNPDLFAAAVWDCPFDSTENVLKRSIDRLTIRILGHDIPVPGRTILHQYAYHPYVQSVLKAALKTIVHMDATPIPTMIVDVRPQRAAQAITIPTLLIVCRNDEKAPVSAVRAIYDALRGYKRLWITNGRHHFDSYFDNPEKYRYKVREFVVKALDGSYQNCPVAKVLEDQNPISARVIGKKNGAFLYGSGPFVPMR
jgi:uncharacterized protein